MGNVDSEKSQMEKDALRKTFDYFPLVANVACISQLGVLYFVESGPTSELSIVRKSAYSYSFPV